MSWDDCGGSCQKYHFRRDKHVFVATTNMFVTRKHVLVATKIVCRDKRFVAKKYFVATKVLSRQAHFCRDKKKKKKRVLFRQTHVCRDKNDTCGRSHQWYIPGRVACVLISLMGSNTLPARVLPIPTSLGQECSLSVFSCNLPPALLAEGATAFTRCCSNTGAERIQEWESAQKVDSRVETLPPVGWVRIHDLPITSSAFYRWAIYLLVKELSIIFNWNICCPAGLFSVSLARLRSQLGCEL